MKISVVRESAPDEGRVALVPGDVTSLVKAGATVAVESGAGLACGFPDAEYAERGAQLGTRSEVLDGAQVLCCVRQADADDLANLPAGALVLGQLNPYEPHASFTRMAERKLSAISLERIPRITRAQSMDVLSSQANLAGYRAVLMAAMELPKIFPMMMTAAGTVVPARIFVVGVGVAGLQAIATAKRLGAVVSAYDIRPAVREQVESLGARFVEIDLDTGESETSGGYAREMDEEFYRKQREKMLEVLAETDVAITTAAIPGRKAPTLVTTEMVEAMKPGSVIIDLAAERGGNCELTRAGETVEHGGVRVVGPVNVASGIGHHASQLYSRNVTTLLKELIRDGELVLDASDEIVAATLIVADGQASSPEIAEAIGIAAGTGAPAEED